MFDQHPPLIAKRKIQKHINDDINQIPNRLAACEAPWNMLYDPCGMPLPCNGAMNSHFGRRRRRQLTAG